MEEDLKPVLDTSRSRTIDAKSGEEEDHFVLVPGKVSVPPVVRKTPVWNYNARSINSKGAALVLAICVAVDTGYYTVLNQIARQIFPDTISLPLRELYAIFLIGVALPQLFYPLAGWLADAYIGRYKATLFSLWLIFIGQCAIFFPFLFLQLIDKAEENLHWVFPLAYLLISAGLAGFRTNIIQFGVDQMVDASGSQISAFIHWYYWTTYVGTTTASLVINCLFPAYDALLIGTGINVLFMATALFLWYCLRTCLVKEPISTNPFKTVCDVLRYASRHKIPEKRSSMTYWEDKIPSRLDLGKHKYGGPFSTEQVENVKTFFAILLILLSLGGFIIVNETNEANIAYDTDNPKVGYSSVHDVLTTQNFVILLAVPICEFLIYPLFQNCISTSLKRIGIGILMDIGAVLSALAIDIYIHEGPDHTPKDKCLSATDMNTNSTTSAAIIIVPVVIDTAAELVTIISSTFSDEERGKGVFSYYIHVNACIQAFDYIALWWSFTFTYVLQSTAFEFIFAQSPYSMRSMLVGIFYTIRGIFAMVPLIINIIIAYGYDSYSKISCYSAFFLVIFIIGVIGFAIYSIVAANYKKRLRDDHFEQHVVVENYFSVQDT